jgi:hypothetical protein
LTWGRHLTLKDMPDQSPSTHTFEGSSKAESPSYPRDVYAGAAVHCREGPAAEESPLRRGQASKPRSILRKTLSNAEERLIENSAKRSSKSVRWSETAHFCLLPSLATRAGDIDDEVTFDLTLFGNEMLKPPADSEEVLAESTTRNSTRARRSEAPPAQSQVRKGVSRSPLYHRVALEAHTTSALPHGDQLRREPPGSLVESAPGLRPYSSGGHSLNYSSARTPLLLSTNVSSGEEPEGDDAEICCGWI